MGYFYHNELYDIRVKRKRERREGRTSERGRSEEERKDFEK